MNKMEERGYDRIIGSHHRHLYQCYSNGGGAQQRGAHRIKNISHPFSVELCRLHVPHCEGGRGRQTARGLVRVTLFKCTDSVLKYIHIIGTVYAYARRFREWADHYGA